MKGKTRRQFLRTSGIVSLLAGSGCLRLSGGNQEATPTVTKSSSEQLTVTEVAETPTDAPNSETTTTPTETPTATPTTTATETATPTATPTPTDSDGVIDDFEDEDVSGWELAPSDWNDSGTTGTQPSEWKTTTDSSGEGSYAGKLFTNSGHDMVQKQLDSPIKPFEIRFWAKYNGDLNSQDFANYNIGKGTSLEGGGEGPPVAITVQFDQFQNGNLGVPDGSDFYILSSGDPTRMRWLEFRLYNIEWDNGTYSVEIRDIDRNLMDSTSGLKFQDSNVDVFEYFRVSNRNNRSNAPIFVDDITYTISR